MDEGDQAQAHSDFFLEKSLSAHRSRRVHPAVCGCIECVDCGEEIPEKRREAKPDCERCVECQELFERRARVYT